MPDYQKMYFDLFNDVTDIIHALQEAQMKTEKMYVESSEPNLTVLNGSNDENKTTSA
jgi:hypothetical protein